MAISIQKMRQDDLDTVIALTKNTKEFQTGTDSPNYYAKVTLERWIRDPHGVALVVCDYEKVIGFFLGSYITAANDGYMNMITVDDAYRGQGIGGRLLEKAIEEFSQKESDGLKCNRIFGVTEIENTATIEFMNKHGIQAGKKFFYLDTMLPRKKA